MNLEVVERANGRCPVLGLHFASYHVDFQCNVGMR